MKLAEIKTLMIQGNTSAELIADFKAALKRSPRSMRCQHCYTTAAEMPKESYLDAITLIEMGLNEYCDSWLDEMRSFYNKGIIYETVEDYPKALLAYTQAAQAVREDLVDSYAAQFAAHKMRMEMHCSGFRYTADLRLYYEKAMENDEFSKSFVHFMFYQALAEMLIFAEDNERSRARDAYLRAKTMLSPTYRGPLSMLLLKNKYIESTKATKQAIKFLRSWKRS